MKLNALGVVSSDLPKTVAFYQLLGFEFPEYKADEQHLEPITPPGGTRLMIDSAELSQSLLGEPHRPSNHSHFALEYDTPAEIDVVVAKVKEAGFTIEKEPWDAFWGQHYAVVKDPDGYMVDLYSAIK
jgi:catechol 2,3-dioxygenase-like lactoylglutathione lyase family enzyme